LKAAGQQTSHFLPPAANERSARFDDCIYVRV